MHETSVGLEVRAFLPDAVAVSVIDRKNGRKVATLERIHPSGFFVARSLDVNVVKDGEQHEVADNWLEKGNPWEFPRYDLQFEVDFGGRLQQEYFLVSASVQDILQRLTVSKIDSKRDVISSLLFY